MAVIALVQFMGIEYAMMGVMTLRANKAPWPAPIEERLLALLFTPVFLKEIGQTEPFLKLDWIFLRHKSFHVTSI